MDRARAAPHVGAAPLAGSRCGRRRRARRCPLGDGILLRTRATRRDAGRRCGRVGADAAEQGKSGMGVDVPDDRDEPGKEEIF